MTSNQKIYRINNAADGTIRRAWRRMTDTQKRFVLQRMPETVKDAELKKLMKASKKEIQVCD